MRKFEYAAVECETIDELVKIANEEGVKGWELVNFQRAGHVLRISAVFKREQEKKK